MNRLRLLFPVLFLLLALSLTSCWDRDELNQLGVIVGVALDPGAGASEEVVEITTQTITPQSQGQSSQGNQAGGQPFENISATGQGPAEASTRLALKSARRMFFGHTQLLVLGENLAERDIRLFMERPGLGFETRRAARVVVAKGVSGKELLSGKVKLSRTPAEGMINLLDQQVRTGLIPDIRLRDFLARLNSETAAAIVPAFTLVSDNPASDGKQGSELTAQSVGTAVFTDGRIAGYLSPTETRGLLWTQGEVPLGVVNVRLPGSPTDQVIALQIRRNFAKTKVEVQDDRVTANIDIEVRADISEYGILRDISKPRSFSILNHQLSLVVQNEVEKTVRKSQDELRADIFNFGEQLRRQDNQNWQRLAPIWDDIYPNVEVTVTVRAIMRHRGTTINPPGVGSS